MQFKLFEARIDRGGEITNLHMVAKTQHRAAAMVVMSDLIRDEQNDSFSIERIDNRLSKDRQMGLEEILAGPQAVVTFTQMGWVAVDQIEVELSLYRVESDESDRTYIVAADPNEATLHYLDRWPFSDDERRVIQISDALPEIPATQRRGLDRLLVIGPRGVVAWNEEDGWKPVL